LGLVQVDAGIGMVLAGAIFWFIVIGTGATLGVHHQQIQTAQDAAKALAPLAGPFAAIIFGIGLLASADARPARAGGHLRLRVGGGRRLEGQFEPALLPGEGLLCQLAALPGAGGGPDACGHQPDPVPLLEFAGRRPPVHQSRSPY